MSSKSNPIAFRLSKNDISQSQWYAYNNYATILHDDLMIQEMIKYTYQRKFLSWVNQIVIRRTSRGIFIFIYAFTSRDVGMESNLFQTKQLESMIQKYLNIQNQKIQIFSYNYYNLYNLEKNELFNEISNTFGHLRWLSLQKEFLRLAFVAVYSRNVTAFCNFVGVRLARVKRHKKIIFIVRQLLSEFILFKNDLVGVRIRFKGRLDGKPRAKQMFLQTGHVPLHTISATISYHLTHVYSKYGTFGLRIWLCFTHSNIEFFNKLNQSRLEKIKNEKNVYNAIEKTTKTKIDEKNHVSNENFLKKTNVEMLVPNPEIFHSYMITKPSESFDILKLKQSYLQKKQWWFSNQYEIVSKKTIKYDSNHLKKKTKFNYLVQKNLNKNLVCNEHGYIIWLFLNKTKAKFANNKEQTRLTDKPLLKILNQLQKSESPNYYNQIFTDLIVLHKKYNFEYSNLTLKFLNEQQKNINSENLFNVLDTKNQQSDKHILNNANSVESSFETLIDLIKNYKKIKHTNKIYKTFLGNKVNLLKTIKTNSIKELKKNNLNKK